MNSKQQKVVGAAIGVAAAALSAAGGVAPNTQTVKAEAYKREAAQARELRGSTTAKGRGQGSAGK